jgi:hypothetical protein
LNSNCIGVQRRIISKTRDRGWGATVERRRVVAIAQRAAAEGKRAPMLKALVVVSVSLTS